MSAGFGGTGAGPAGVAPEPDRRFRLRDWWSEASGAVADLGVLVPIALALVVANGLAVSAVFVSAGCAYLLVAVVYRVPVAVQPLKAFGAVAIATGAGADAIAAGAIVLGVVFVCLAATGGARWLASVIPAAVIRGVQISVGLLFFRIAVGLVAEPPAAFSREVPSTVAAAVGLALLAALLWRRGSSALVLVAASAIVAVATALAAGAIPAAGLFGPSPIVVPSIDAATLAFAAVVLVLPQIPLSLTNACLAPPSAAARYFGESARRVTPGRLALTLGALNVGIGAVGGMPVCHGSGGMSAHHAFGARTWRAPALIGAALVVAGLGAAGFVAAVLPWFPTPALAALLAAAGVAHVRLAADLRGRRAWLIASVVAVLGLAGYLLVGVVAGAVLDAALRWRDRRGEDRHRWAVSMRVDGQGERGQRW